MSDHEIQQAIQEIIGKPFCGDLTGDNPFDPKPHQWGAIKAQDAGGLGLNYRMCQRCPALYILGERFCTADDEKMPPNYLLDWNGVHAFEAKLTTPELLYRYQRWLCHLVGDHAWPAGSYIIKANQRQHCEAFLRVFAGWPD